MFIDIHELEAHPIDFREEIRPQVIDLGEDVRQVTVLKASGHADLVEEHRSKRHTIQDIRLRGDLATRLEVSCARCLEPVAHDVARNFELLYRPQGTDAGPDERPVAGNEAEIGYYQGDGLQLEDVLREQVLLALPLRSLCSEQCRGLCPQCGKNLNLETCSCVQDQDDPRWTALKDIKKMLEQ
jgi:DUF177 domain-containing protein